MESFCLLHWIALNLGYLSTPRQKMPTKPSTKRLWDPTTLKPEGPQVIAESREPQGCKPDHKDLNSKSCTLSLFNPPRLLFQGNWKPRQRPATNVPFLEL